jgi:hypothetical protein
MKMRWLYLKSLKQASAMQANRVNISCRDETGEELIVPPGDLASQAE